MISIYKASPEINWIKNDLKVPTFGGLWSIKYMSRLSLFLTISVSESLYFISECVNRKLWFILSGSPQIKYLFYYFCYYFPTKKETQKRMIDFTFWAASDGGYSKELLLPASIISQRVLKNYFSTNKKYFSFTRKYFPNNTADIWSTRHTSSTTSKKSHISHIFISNCSNMFPMTTW